MESARHERVVLDGVAEHDELAGSDALAIGGRLGGLLDDTRHFERGVHVDARARGSQVHRRAHAVGGGQGVGDGIHELVVRGGNAFCTRAEKPPTKSTPTSLPARFMATATGERSLASYGGAHLGNRGDGDALVDDGDAEFAFELLGGGHEVLGGGGHAVVDLSGQAVDVGVDAAAQVRPSVMVRMSRFCLLTIAKRFGDLSRGDLHGFSHLSRKAARAARRRVRNVIVSA